MKPSITASWCARTVSTASKRHSMRWCSSSGRRSSGCSKQGRLDDRPGAGGRQQGAERSRCSTASRLSDGVGPGFWTTSSPWRTERAARRRQLCSTPSSCLPSRTTRLPPRRMPPCSPCLGRTAGVQHGFLCREAARFPGGSVGHLAVHGTINDLAMMGARPIGSRLLSCSKKGFAIDELREIVADMADAAPRPAFRS